MSLYQPALFYIFSSTISVTASPHGQTQQSLSHFISQTDTRMAFRYNHGDILRVTAYCTVLQYEDDISWILNRLVYMGFAMFAQTLFLNLTSMSSSSGLPESMPRCDHETNGKPSKNKCRYGLQDALISQPFPALLMENTGDNNKGHKKWSHLVRDKYFNVKL